MKKSEILTRWLKDEKSTKGIICSILIDAVLLSLFQFSLWTKPL